MAYRKLGENPFYGQLVGGIAITYGNTAELKAEEGKALFLPFPAFFNA